MKNEEITRESENNEIFFNQFIQYSSQTEDKMFVDEVLKKIKYMQYKRILFLSIFGFIGLALFFWTSSPIPTTSNVNLAQIGKLALQLTTNAMLISILFISTWFIVEEE